MRRRVLTKSTKRDINIMTEPAETLKSGGAMGYTRYFDGTGFASNSASILCGCTPSNSEIICGQNVGTKVVCGMI